MKFEPIDLDRSTSLATQSNAPSGPSGLNLFIENTRVSELPESGEITFRFTRGPVTAVEALRGIPARAHVDLTLTEICKVKADPKESEEKAEQALDDIFKEAQGEE